MPNYDQTGPIGRGPLSGRGRGYCHPKGRGPRGFKRGWCQFDSEYCPRPFYVESIPTEKEFLQKQAEVLEQDLRDIKARLSDLETKD